MRDELLLRLEQVLENMIFPARRWQIIAKAEMHAADTALRTLVHGLPIRLYEDRADVVGAIRRGRNGAPPTDTEPTCPPPRSLGDFTASRNAEDFG